jgi:hypothetical protein
MTEALGFMAVLHIDNLGVRMEGSHVVDPDISNYIGCLLIQFVLPESL